MFREICLLLVVGLTLSEQKAIQKEPSKPIKSPSVYKLHAYSQIHSRFASTKITSRILNPAQVDQEVVFRVQLPTAGFITNFTMLINDELIVGNVKDKKAAQKDYDEAKAKGQSAGLVKKNARETNKFDIAMNLKAFDSVECTLTYQELLARVQGAYKHVININPGQVVDDFKICVEIEEKRNFSFVTVPEFGPKLSDRTNKGLIARNTAQEVDIQFSTVDGTNKAIASYSPDAIEQRSISSKGYDGMQFVVLYDVERDFSAGEIEVVNGYFVHFIAPKGQELPPGSKHVVFVLDVSGSMGGDKIRQLRESMLLILDDLKSNDMFNIIKFDNEVVVNWKESLQANEYNVKQAKTFVGSLAAGGSTNIYGALWKGMDLLKQKPGDTLTSMMIFLTDGQPTVNETDPDKILQDVNRWNKEYEFTIHSISFGDYADFDLLQKISTQNQGVARKVYEDADAAIQLAGFYDEISSPLLTNLRINYLNESVMPNSIVKSEEHTCYEGGEIVVVGQLAPAKSDKKIDYELKATVEGDGADGAVLLDVAKPLRCEDTCQWRPVPSPRICMYDDIALTRAPHCHYYPIIEPCYPICPIDPITTPEPTRLEPSSYGGFIERTWAYMTIQKLLNDAKYKTEEATEQKELENRALFLSLKYQFVTELTSMVVTQPDSDKPFQTNLPEASGSAAGAYGGGAYGSGGGGGASYGKAGIRPSLNSFPSFPSPYVNGYNSQLADYSDDDSEEDSSAEQSKNVPYITHERKPEKIQCNETNDSSFVELTIGKIYLNVTAGSIDECSNKCINSGTCTSAVYHNEALICSLSFHQASTGQCQQWSRTATSVSSTVLQCCCILENCGL